MTVPQCKGYFDIIHDIYFLTADWNNTKLDTKVKKQNKEQVPPFTNTVQPSASPQAI
jgi:hypothetical protein